MSANETVEQVVTKIAARHFGACAFCEIDAQELISLLSDPAVLELVPGVKELREENERLTRERDMLEQSITHWKTAYREDTETLRDSKECALAQLHEVVKAGTNLSFMAQTTGGGPDAKLIEAINTFAKALELASVAEAHRQFEQQRDRIASLEQENERLTAYNATRTDELMAAAKRIATLEAANAAQAEQLAAMQELNLRTSTALAITGISPKDKRIGELQEACVRYKDALEEIAMAGMSMPMLSYPTEESTQRFHAKQAWKFIGIAAHALKPEVAPPEPQAGVELTEIINDLRHSAKVDDYEPQHIGFIESIADRIERALNQRQAVKAEPAIEALSMIGEVLGLDEDDAGPTPIIDKIVCLQEAFETVKRLHLIATNQVVDLRKAAKPEPLSAAQGVPEVTALAGIVLSEMFDDEIICTMKGTRLLACHGFAQRFKQLLSAAPAAQNEVGK